MKTDVEPMQQPIRRVVGRPRSQRATLVNIDQLNCFILKYARRSMAGTEGDYFQVRKAVGKSRAGES